MFHVNWTIKNHILKLKVVFLFQSFMCPSVPEIWENKNGEKKRKEGDDVTQDFNICCSIQYPVLPFSVPIYKKNNLNFGTFVLNAYNPDYLISISTVGTFEFYGESTWFLDFGYPQFLCSLISWTQNSLDYDCLFVFCTSQEFE